MKVSLKLADIEVLIEDPAERNRKSLEAEALECVDALIQSRIVLECGLSSPAEDEPGQIPVQKEHKINPNIEMVSLYV